MGLQDRLTESAAQEAIGQVHRYYAEMEAMLQDRDYLGGEYTYADIAFFMAQIFAARLGAPMTGVTPRLLALGGGGSSPPPPPNTFLHFSRSPPPLLPPISPFSY